MRTTLSIDDDVLAAAKALARKHERSVGEIISELARRPLKPAAGRRGTQRNSTADAQAGQPAGDARARQLPARRRAVTFLLDANVLIGLIDPGHVTHEDAHRWFQSTGRSSWATCPITENGVMRIVGNPRYPNSPGSPAAVGDIVGKLRGIAGHSFWAMM